MTTNLAHIGETALLVAAAYLLGCFLGYATRRIFHAGRGTRQVTQPANSAAGTTPSRARSNAARLAAIVRDAPSARSRALARSSSGSQPLALARPRNGVADNLKQIKGIGPKIEASLYAMGIYHFDQIAVWTAAEVEWVDARLAFKGRIRRERWVEQAGDRVRAEA